MTTLTIEDLQAIRTELKVAASRARKEAEALVGADVLSAWPAADDIGVAKLRPATRSAMTRTNEMCDLHARVGVVLDDMLVAADPEGVNAPAAHARVHERNTNNKAEESV